MVNKVKSAKADVFLRDTDSQSLFNNTGILSYKYYHEWNDCYNPTTDDTLQIDGERYDESTGSYSPNYPSGYDAVFNGRQSALWDNIVACFPDKVKEIYEKMRSNGLNSKDMLSKYKEFWSYWCENLYNADAFGYANTGNFSMAYGDKVQVMNYFFEKRQRYLDSKYQCGSSAEIATRMRLYGSGNGVAIKYCQAIYANLQWGAGNYKSQRNIKPGSYSYMPYSLSGAQNATFVINDADLVTELSTYTKNSQGVYTIKGIEGLGDCYFDQQMSLLKRLTKFVMNYTASNPNTLETGKSFDMSTMSMLKQVIVRNVKNLKNSIVLSSDLLEEIDFTGTPITGVTTPPADMLTKLVLPNTIKELNLVGYTNLQVSGLQVAGYSNIETLHIEDCPNLDSYEIAKACYDAGAKLNNVVLKGIDWNLASMDLLLTLAKNGATLQGKVTVLDSVNVTAKQVLILRNAFGDITAESNSLYVSYTEHPIQKIEVVGDDDYITKAGDYQYDFNVTPNNGNNVESLSWEVQENDFATIDKKTGVLSVKKTGAEENSDKVIITLVASLDDGSTIKASKDLLLYEPEANVCDIVFSNGTYGTKLKSNATPIGVCVYVNPKNKKQRVMMSLNTIGTYSWGIDSYTFKDLELSDKAFSIFDISEILNVSINTQATIGNMYDSITDTFKEYQIDTNIGNLGFFAVTSALYSSLQEYLDDIGIKEASYIDKGQLETLQIIKHRDTILGDANISLEIPKKYKNQTEKERLDYLINNLIMEQGDNNYKQYYYAAASYAYAYEPNVPELLEKFKAHHWFLPSSGMLCRVSYYVQRGYGNGKDAIFSNAINLQLMSKVKEGMYATSTEAVSGDNSRYTAALEITSGNTQYGYPERHLFKGHDFLCFAFCAF